MVVGRPKLARVALKANDASIWNTIFVYVGATLHVQISVTVLNRDAFDYKVEVPDRRSPRFLTLLHVVILREADGGQH